MRASESNLRGVRSASGTVMPKLLFEGADHVRQREGIEHAGFEQGSSGSAGSGFWATLPDYGEDAFLVRHRDLRLDASFTRKRIQKQFCGTSSRVKFIRVARWVRIAYDRSNVVVLLLLAELIRSSTGARRNRAACAAGDAGGFVREQAGNPVSAVLIAPVTIDDRNAFCPKEACFERKRARWQSGSESCTKPPRWS